MSNKGSLYYLLVLIMLFGIISACSPSSARVEPEEVVEESVSTLPSAGSGGEEPAAGDAEATQTPALGVYGQPIDVPIMDDHRDFQISRSSQNMGFTMDGIALEEVYTWYQEKLTEAGWHEGPNEAPVGSRNNVTIARTNDASDRITITMQFNSIGDFVLVSIVLNRAP